jgi:hypothetical protein
MASSLRAKEAKEHLEMPPLQLAIQDIIAFGRKCDQALKVF